MFRNLALSLTIGFFSQMSTASEIASSHCETCITDQQYMTHARSLVNKDETKVVHIFNMSEYGYKKYNITRTSYIECEYDNEPDGRGGRQQICRRQFKYSTAELVVSNQELSEFTEFALVYNDTAKFLKQNSIEVPSIVSDTAFDLVGDTYTQNAVILYLQHGNSFEAILDRLHSYAGGVSRLVTTPIMVNSPIIAFKFSDGTFAYAILDFVDSDGKLHFKFIKIQDASGNSLDLRKDNPFPASYTFINMSQDSWEAFFRAMQRLGLTVRGASESIIPKGIVRIVHICGDNTNPCPSPN